MSPAVPNQVCRHSETQMTSSLLTIDEPESGEPQVPPTGHQARKLEPRRGQRGGQGRGEAAQER